MTSPRIIAALMLAAATLGNCVAQKAASPEALPVVVEALKPSPIDTNLRRLTDEIGGRVPGTAAMQQAEAWAVAAFKAAGADAVSTESFTMPVLWSEGNTRVEVTSPVKFAVRARSIAWSPALPAPLKARVVDVGDGSHEAFARAGNLAGAVILVHSDVLHTWEDLFNEYLKAPPIISRAVKGKAAAIAWIATREHDILYRHTNNLKGGLDRLPGVIVAREDGERIGRLLSAGKPVQLELSLPNRIGGPIKAANVVAEIRGSELPNEYVILGAHLDSWELGTGALDNGCNSALVIDVLRSIKATGIKPRRTIRFVLFSGEEQGMLGSRAYVRQHRSELDNVVAELVIDSGMGKITGFSLGGRKDIVNAISKLMTPFDGWGANTHTIDAFVGTDNLDFLLEGVPTLVANQDPGNYLVNYHATSDTYDKVDIPQLKKHVAICAHAVSEIANAKDRLGARQTRDEIEQLMQDTQLDQQLQLFGLWEDWQTGKLGRAR